MKIDPRAESSKDVTAVTADQARHASKPEQKKASDSDEVALSSTLRLADEAVRAAAISGDVRPQAVERARRLLQAGEIGQNAGRLADRIIDSLIQSRVERT